MTIDELIDELKFYKEELGEDGGKAEVLIYAGCDNEPISELFAHSNNAVVIASQDYYVEIYSS